MSYNSQDSNSPYYSQYDSNSPAIGMSKAAFTAKVMPAFGVALAIAAAGTMVGGSLGFAGQIVSLIGTLILAFTAGMWSRQEGLNKVLFALYAFMSGVSTLPLLAWASMRGGEALIGQALLASTVTFIGVGVYGLVSKKDFANLGGALMVGLIAMIAVSLLNTFIFHSSFIGLAVSFFSVGIFAVFTAYDMNQIIRNYEERDYILGALQLFIDFMGLFTSILRVLGLVGGGSDD
jgi:FtsH-binding integral membrane protein